MATARGPLHTARGLLAFLRPLPVEGDLALAAHVVGAPDDPHIGVAFATPRGWLLAQTAIGATAGMLVYDRGRMTMPFARARYEGITVQVNGDVDVGSAGLPAGQLIAMQKNERVQSRLELCVPGSCWIKTVSLDT